MSDFVQSRIRYIFNDKQLIQSALRSAHRDRENDELVDDGNRGLAYYGTSAMSMVETHNAIVESGKTLHDFNSQIHWSRTKKGRAIACKALGFEPFITRSIRQQHLPASEIILDNAFSAIIGAVWLDCEAQGKSVGDTRRTVWEMLQEIDTVLESSPSTSGDNSALHSMSQDVNTTTAHAVNQSGIVGLVSGYGLDDDMENFTQEWCAQTFGNPLLGQLSYEDGFTELQEPLIQASVETDKTFLVEGCLVDDFGEGTIMLSDQNVPTCAELGAEFERLANTGDGIFQGRPFPYSSEAVRNSDSNATTPATCAKRKRVKDSEETATSTYRGMLHSEQQNMGCVSRDEQEKLARFLYHPEINNLGEKSSVLFHFLYLAIGTWQTIYDFRSQLRLARNIPSVYKRLSISGWSAAERYNEICHLEKEEALCVLLRRYHTINLCENEQKLHGYGSHIFVETPCTVGSAGRSNPGNPVSALDASLTNQLLYKIMPDARPETENFKKARPKVKRLRKLARYLHILVRSYGFGILALLPSGPSFGNVSLTDNMLLSLSEPNFVQFAQLLFREQGPLLKSLSQFVEPSLLALASCSLDSGAVYSIERLDVSYLSSRPKGLLDLSQCPLISEHLS